MRMREGKLWLKVSQVHQGQLNLQLNETGYSQQCGIFLLKRICQYSHLVSKMYKYTTDLL